MSKETWRKSRFKAQLLRTTDEFPRSMQNLLTRDNSLSTIERKNRADSPGRLYYIFGTFGTDKLCKHCEIHVSSVSCHVPKDYEWTDRMNKSQPQRKRQNKSELKEFCEVKCKFFRTLSEWEIVGALKFARPNTCDRIESFEVENFTKGRRGKHTWPTKFSRDASEKAAIASPASPT